MPGFTTRTARPALAAALCLAAAACGAAADDQAAREVEAALREPPGAQALYDTLEAEFPAEYEALVSQVAEAGEAGASAEQVRAAFVPAFAALLTELTPHAAQAPQPELFAWRDRMHELIRTAAEASPEACARLAMGTAGELPGMAGPEQLRATSQMQVALIEAAAAGKRDPHPRERPSEAELDAFDAAFAASGLSDAELAIWADEQAIANAAPEVQCKLGTAVYDALAALPADAGSARLAVAVLGTSGG